MVNEWFIHWGGMNWFWKFSHSQVILIKVSSRQWAGLHSYECGLNEMLTVTVPLYWNTYSFFTQSSPVSIDIIYQWEHGWKGYFCQPNGKHNKYSLSFSLPSPSPIKQIAWGTMFCTGSNIIWHTYTHADIHKEHIAQRSLRQTDYF